MIRYTVRIAVLLLLIFLPLFGIKLYLHNAKQKPPLFLQHKTFLEGTGIKTLGKHFLLRYKSDRIFFSASKNRVKQQRALWNKNVHFNIPKVIHILWLKEEPLPEEVEQNEAYIRQYNPHCTCTLWRKEALIKRMSEKELQLFTKLPAALQKVYASAFLLYYDGGVIIDPSVQLMGSFEEVLSSGEWIISLEAPLSKSIEKRRLWLSSCFIAGTPHHPLTKKWVLAMDKYFALPANTQKTIKKQYLEGMMLPLMNLLSSDCQEKEASYILPATCFSPIAPQFIHSYLKKVTGEEEKEKKKNKHFITQSSPPFSKITRCSIGIHLKGGSLAEISSEDKKEQDPL